MRLKLSKGENNPILRVNGVGSTARLGGCACIAPLPALPQDAWFAVHLLICRDQIVPLMSVNSSE